MRTVQLETITIAGFKSYKQPVTIALTTEAGLKFIGGRNLEQPRLGANGAGKSSVWDAVNWCWYGTSLRGAKAAALRPEGAERAEVQTRVRIGPTAHLVGRSSHPERITLDGQPATQEEVDRLLGLGRVRFAQSVVFGQAVPLFYDLAVPQRGDLLDELLEGDLWTTAADEAGREARQYQADADDVRRTVAKYQGQLKEQETTEADLRRAADEWITDCDAKINTYADEVEDCEKEIDKLRDMLAEDQTYAELYGESKDVKAVRKDISGLQVVIATHRNRTRECEGLLDFYKHRAQCPTCKQRINEMFREDQIESLTHELQLTKQQITTADKLLRQYEQALSDIEKQDNDREAAFRKVTATNRQIKEAQDRLDRAYKSGQEWIRRRDDENPSLRLLKESQERRLSLHREMRQHVGKLGRLEAQASRAQYWKSGFKRVRVFRMKRVLARLDIETANSANALGLIGWHIRFRAETEGSRPGVYIDVETGDKNQQREWSPGELQRVRLAVSLGLAHLIQQMSGVVYPWEVFDEPSNWLSPEGIEDLLEQLKYRADSTSRSIWLVDHRALIYSGFSETWEVCKDSAGSQMRLVSKAETE